MANCLLKYFKFTMSLMQKTPKLRGEFIIKWDTDVIVISNPPSIKVHVNRESNALLLHRAKNLLLRGSHI